MKMSDIAYGQTYVIRRRNGEEITGKARAIPSRIREGRTNAHVDFETGWGTVIAVMAGDVKAPARTRPGKRARF